MSDLVEPQDDKPSQLFIKCMECLGFYPDCPNCGGRDMRMIPMSPEDIARLHAASEAEQDQFSAMVFKWGIGNPVEMYGRIWQKRPEKTPQRTWE